MLEPRFAVSTSLTIPFLIGRFSIGSFILITYNYYTPFRILVRWLQKRARTKIHVTNINEVVSIVWHACHRDVLITTDTYAGLATDVSYTGMASSAYVICFRSRKGRSFSSLRLYYVDVAFSMHANPFTNHFGLIFWNFKTDHRTMWNL
ncbi:hypothetical protein BDF20DRAFT_988804 [Mycotypha africana]|uniref:uncharacterized protein n=1 Tax=Mycotypha africana TaxID=64632 RepID=UPI002301D62D|nr:uncharacterized protein BDF20DRAFT_988804 [Mycotypha africana]KAI8975281.1 hypothetical protein BDF20DRAFT_988804 [Mycotypha africana]